MKRCSLVLLTIVALLLATNAPAKTKKKKAPLQPTCATNLENCALEGCSSDNHHDPKLNRLKNRKTSSATVTDRSLTWMKGRPNPTHYTPGGSRTELTALGEGDQVRVVGYLLAVKLELGGESCNCYLRTEPETDNHLVLVTQATVNKFPLPAHANTTTLKKVFHKREAESVTAEYTPRVRLDHPNFTNEKTQPLINKTAQGALKVRVTGPLMFDSEHFFEHHLNRVNNWEIHPIFRLEYCPKGKTCTADSDANWQDIDAEP
ncbi:MAG TPA: hypothetical protein VHR36_11775 [Pyrinomonadaceae bacterium]|jgi:hypothetical protein|nr:hypothetical protein [Pyrinomonadaceae bacterium]